MGGRGKGLRSVAFTSPRVRFLAAADRIKTTTESNITMKLDEESIRRKRYENTNDGFPGFNNAWSQAPKMSIQRLGEGRQLKATRCSGAPCEGTKHAEIRQPSLGKAPATVIHRRN